MRGVCSRMRGPLLSCFFSLLSPLSLLLWHLPPVIFALIGRAAATSLAHGLFSPDPVALSVQDNLLNGLEVFLATEGQLEGGERRAKTPGTGNDSKSICTVQLPCLCSWPPKWMLVWMSLALLPERMGIWSVRKASSIPETKPLSFPLDSGQGCLEKQEGSWSLALRGQVHPTGSVTIWTKVEFSNKVRNQREAGKTVKHLTANYL